MSLVCLCSAISFALNYCQFNKSNYERCASDTWFLLVLIRSHSLCVYKGDTGVLDRMKAQDDRLQDVSRFLTKKLTKRRNRREKNVTIAPSWPPSAFAIDSPSIIDPALSKHLMKTFKKSIDNNGHRMFFVCEIFQERDDVSSIALVSRSTEATPQNVNSILQEANVPTLMIENESRFAPRVLLISCTGDNTVKITGQQTSSVFVRKIDIQNGEITHLEYT